MLTPIYKHICILAIWLFPALAFGATYTVSTATNTVNGATFCGGSACTSADTIVITGGARGNLLFQNFNGAGSYITITNQNINPDSRVVITNDGASGWSGGLSIQNCQYIDLRGDGDGDITYGIKVIHDGVPNKASAVWAYGESDYVKISYLEVAFDGNTQTSGIGIQVQDATLSTSSTFTGFEIHHNYIHNTRYSAMYLGHNNPPSNNDPYIASFSVHNNLMEDLGTYGITFKGVNGGPNYIYNNTIRRTGLVAGYTDMFYGGIGVLYFYNGYYAEVYNNRMEDIVGTGIKAVEWAHNTKIYNNELLGCGSGLNPTYGHGIWLSYSNNVQVYDNIILQAGVYGIQAGGGTGGTLDRNLIGDCGSGEWNGTGVTEGTGANANIYYANIADFGFTAWSDDSDYSNDILTFLVVTNPYPTNAGNGLPISTTATWTNPVGATSVDVMWEVGVNPPTVKVIDDGVVETYDPPADLGYSQTVYWRVDVNHAGGTEIGTVWSFTTQGTPPSFATVQHTPSGGMVPSRDKSGINIE